MMRSRNGRMRSIAVGALLMGGAMAFAGCTTTATPEPTQTVDDVTDVTDQPGSWENFVGAAQDAETESCAREGDNWVASGTVTNPTDVAQDYRVYVSVLDTDSETRGVIQVNVDDVAPEESGDWEASFALPDDELQCVLRVERAEVEE